MAIHLDYETRSRADLKEVGADRYARDPSTRILMAAVSRDDGPVYLWVNPLFRTDDEMGDPEASILLASIGFDEEMWAHNAPFELAMTVGRVEDIHIKVPINKWRCTMAMARRAGLPQGLGQLAETLGLKEQKDRAGYDLIRFFCVPRKDGQFNEPKDYPDKWVAFCNYCRQDVVTEKAIHRRMKVFELKGDLLDGFLFDLRMNQRGFPVNVEGLKHAKRIIDEIQTSVGAEFRKITGLNPTQREKVRELVDLPNMQSETVAEAIKNHSDESVVILLEMYQKLSYAAVAKVEKMLSCACPDGRVRGGHLWYGTGPGRSSGQLVQPQNFKKTPPELRPITDKVYERICAGASTFEIESFYGEPLELISACIRNFIHAPGHEMLDGDYSAIQARVICWLAGQTDALEDYTKGVDRYKLMAAEIYQVALAAVNSDQREVGKRAILGLGFQMGEEKFQSSCREQYGLELSDELCLKAKQAFRRKHPKIVEYWYRLQNDAIRAIKSPGNRFGEFVCRDCAGLPYLLAYLPSGRCLAYPRPEVHIAPGTPAVTKVVNGEVVVVKKEVGPREQITYWGQDAYSTQWTRIKLYGGKLAENLTMAVEADLMAHGMITAEARGFEINVLVHDQALGIRKPGQDPKDFGDALASVPQWAAGLPVKVDSHVSPYYRK